MNTPTCTCTSKESNITVIKVEYMFMYKVYPKTENICTDNDTAMHTDTFGMIVYIDRHMHVYLAPLVHRPGCECFKDRHCGQLEP